MSVAIERGRALADRYLLVEPLARGAMGELWVAEDRRLGRMVAVKVIGGAVLATELTRARFQREALAAARIQSPHVVPVFDHGEDRGVAFIVMELLDGESLDQYLGRLEVCPLGRAVWMAEQVSRGLMAAHEAGVIHRDLKPANLFLTTAAGQALIKVLDFGIARIDDFDGAATTAGSLVGSPYYMSPEQASGKPVDHRSDLFSFGTILYDALTGTRAFFGDSLVDVLDRVRALDLDPPSALVPGLPPAVDGFFARAMARDPDHRYRSALEMAQTFAVAAGVPAEPMWPAAPARPRLSASRPSNPGAASRPEPSQPGAGARPSTGPSETLDQPRSTPGSASQAGMALPFGAPEPPTLEIPAAPARGLPPAALAVAGVAMTAALGLAVALAFSRSEEASGPAESAEPAPAAAEITPSAEPAPTEGEGGAEPTDEPREDDVDTEATSNPGTEGAGGIDEPAPKRRPVPYRRPAKKPPPKPPSGPKPLELDY